MFLPDNCSLGDLYFPFQKKMRSTKFPSMFMVWFLFTSYHILWNLSFIHLSSWNCWFFLPTFPTSAMGRLLGSIHHPKLWSVPVNIQKVLCPFDPQMFFRKNWGKRTMGCLEAQKMFCRKESDFWKESGGNLFGFRICDLPFDVSKTETRWSPNAGANFQESVTMP